MNKWLAEIMRSWRASWRRPGFLLLAACVLALGVGASTTVFTLVYNVEWRPLALPNPGRLVAIGTDTGQTMATPYQYEHFGQLQGVESTGFVLHNSNMVNIVGGGVPTQATALRASRGLLPTLGIHVALGHSFTAREDSPHGPPVVMLGHRYWERAFGGNTGAIGKALIVKGVAHTIIGVLPPRFDTFCDSFLYGCDIVLPTTLTPATAVDNNDGFAIARLAPAASRDAVAAQVTARMRRLYAASAKDAMKRARFSVVNLATAFRGEGSITDVLYVGIGLLVLLVAWANLANLLFLRTFARQHDDAIRVALGASGLRRHIPVLAESVLVGALGGFIGIGLAALGMALLRRGLPASLSVGKGMYVDTATWIFAFAAAIACTLVATLLGLWRSRRVDLNVALHERTQSGLSRRLGFLSRALVIAQVALATVLLALSGLLVSTLVHAVNVPLGFNTSGVLTFAFDPLTKKYPDAESVLAFTRHMRRRLSAEPGVLRTDVVTALPTGPHSQIPTHVGTGPVFISRYVGVDPGYFATLSIPLIKGRMFTRQDVRGGARVVVVNQAFAREHFGGHALGKVVHVNLQKPMTLQVIGVVGNTRVAGPLQPAPAMLYVPLQQAPDMFFRFTLNVMLRVHGNPNAYRRLVHSVMAQTAPMQPIVQVQPLERVVARTLDGPRSHLLIVGICGVLALLLAAAGMYAVVAVAVASREHEFGVRVALGASPARLVRLVVRGCMWQIVIGLAIGLAVAVLLSTVMRSAFAGLAAPGPMVIGGVCLVLFVSGLLACLLPAMRAGHVQPMHALRGE